MDNKKLDKIGSEDINDVMYHLTTEMLYKDSIMLNGLVPYSCFNNGYLAIYLTNSYDTNELWHDWMDGIDEISLLEIDVRTMISDMGEESVIFYRDINAPSVMTSVMYLGKIDIKYIKVVEYVKGIGY